MNKHSSITPYSVLTILLVMFSFSEMWGQLIGDASYYADKFHGRRTANGETYSKFGFTAAHRTLPFGTRVKVIRTDNGRSVVVRINDRGPFSPDRVIDLSRAAAEQINMIQAGVVRVELEILTEGSDVAFDPASSPSYQDKTEMVDLQDLDGPRKDLKDLPIRDHNGKLLNQKEPNPPSRPVREETTESYTTPADELPAEVTKYTPALFQMVAAKEEFLGYGVQVGAYFNYYRMMEALNEMQEKGFLNTLVQNGVKDGKPIFRILIGPFSTRAEADKVRKDAAKKGKKGLIVDLATLGLK
jgi:rare lipoprotein A